MPIGVYERKKGVRPWLVKANLGRKLSEEHKRKIGLKSIGNKYAVGYKITDELRQKRKERMVGNKYALDKNLNEKHHNWKGDKALKTTIHKWLKRRLGKASFCTFNKEHEGLFEWANKNHSVSRDVNDYMSLCIRCHRKYDKNPISLHNYIQKLTPENIEEIRSLYKKGGITQKEIGIKYNVGREHINEIINNKVWKT